MQVARFEVRSTAAGSGDGAAGGCEWLRSCIEWTALRTRSTRQCRRAEVVARNAWGARRPAGGFTCAAAGPAGTSVVAITRPASTPPLTTKPQGTQCCKASNRARTGSTTTAPANSSKHPLWPRPIVIRATSLYPGRSEPYRATGSVTSTDARPSTSPGEQHRALRHLGHPARPRGPPRLGRPREHGVPTRVHGRDGHGSPFTAGFSSTSATPCPEPTHTPSTP